MKIKEDYIITVDSTYTGGGETDSMSLTTVGSYYVKNGKRYICYRESEATGFEGHTTTIKASDSGVSIKRFGKTGSLMIIEKGAVNVCNYKTPMGEVLLDISGVEIENHLDEKGGTLNFKYELSLNGELLSENEIIVTVKEIK